MNSFSQEQSLALKTRHEETVRNEFMKPDTYVVETFKPAVLQQPLRGFIEAIEKEIFRSPSFNK
jgi:hypothetical protein